MAADDGDQFHDKRALAERRHEIQERRAEEDDREERIRRERLEASSEVHRRRFPPRADRVCAPSVYACK
jgi:hypothetical protein